MEIKKPSEKYFYQNITQSISKDQLWEMFLNGDIKIKINGRIKADLDGLEQDEFLKCKNDIVYFAENYFTISNPDIGEHIIQLYDWQKKELENWKSNRKSNTVQSRQIGGTTIQTLFATHQALFFDNQNVAILFNREFMTKEFLNRIKVALRNIPNYLKQEIPEYSKHDIRFANGSRIFTYVITIDSLCGHSVNTLILECGHSVNTLILDNPDYIEQTTLDEFWQALIPMLSIHKNYRIILCGTPESAESIHHNRKFIGFNTNHYPWWVIPNRDEQWKTTIKKTMKMDQWMNEYELKYAYPNSIVEDEQL